MNYEMAQNSGRGTTSVPFSMQARSRRAIALAFSLVFSLSGLSEPAYAQADAHKINVLTQRNDNGRSGANLQEKILTIGDVSAQSKFGKLFSVAVEGNIYAQPLYVSGVERGTDRIRNVVYVATERNNVYALDADTGEQIWSKNLGLPMSDTDITDYAQNTLGLSYDWVYEDLYPDIGITSTPAIDIANRLLFVVAKLNSPGDSNNPIYVYRLYALKLDTGENAQAPTDIRGSVKGDTSDAKNGVLVFAPSLQLNRPGLLLANGKLYIGFGSQGDVQPYHGWVFAYQTAHIDQPPEVFCTTPAMLKGPSASLRLIGYPGGGIWQSGSGLVADSAGNVYLSTGNGLWDGQRDFSDSIVKLGPDLKLLDWFTPWEHKLLDEKDLDLGSGGPVLVSPQILVAGGKEGKLYLLNPNRLGHNSVTAAVENSHIWQSLQVTLLPPAGQHPTKGNHFHHIHAAPTLWNTSDGVRLYVWPEMEKLKAFKINAADRRLVADGESSILAPLPLPHKITSMPGGILSISADGDQRGTGILWATIPLKEDANRKNVPGVLRAFDALDITKEIWNSEENSNDTLGYFAKFNPPTIANGKVYVATFAPEDSDEEQTGCARLVVYGLFGDGGRKNPEEYQTRPAARCGDAG
jgi:outer membrane protein assembly factor BamB